MRHPLQPPLDREAYLDRPIAHRGSHGAAGHVGAIENTASAFSAAIAEGYGIECDIRRAAGGLPVIFHDTTTGRLCETDKPVADLTPSRLKGLPIKDTSDRILSLEEGLDLIAGRVPAFVEIKSDWTRPDPSFVSAVAAAINRATGPIAVMSFDPAMLQAMWDAAPAVPRGLVACNSRIDTHNAQRDSEKADRLSYLLNARTAGISFVAYAVDDLPTPVTQFIRAVVGWPLLTWTVRTPLQWERAAAHADAAIFEGSPPRAAAHR